MTEIQYIDAANVGYLPTIQDGERVTSFGNPLMDLPTQFASGWDVGQGIIKGAKPTKTQTDAIHAYRRGLIAQWEDTDGTFPSVLNAEGEAVESTTYARLASFAKDLWFPDGKPVAIHVVANVCNRRTFALAASLISYQKANNTQEFFKVPVEIRKYADAADALRERIKENVLPGRSSYQLTDLLGIACKMLKETACSSAELRRILDIKHGTSMKLHNWAKICLRFPELNLLARAQMPHPIDGKGNKIPKPKYEKGEYYPFSAINHQAARTLIGGCEKDDSCDQTVVNLVWGGTSPGICNREATDDEIEKYLNVIMSESTKARGVLDKTQMTNIKDSTSNPHIRSIMQGILNGNAEAVNDVGQKLNELQEQVNQLTTENQELKAELATLKPKAKAK